MKHDVQVAIQIVPLSGGNAYTLIDQAIEVIAASGIPFLVGPMETVMQGPYDKLMDIAKRAQQACLDHGANEVVVTLKVHAKKSEPLTWEEKGLNRRSF